ncbi:MAG: hypothetical protein ACJ8MO_06850, partial [Bacillus sp. (in: firmicutes)]
MKWADPSKENDPDQFYTICKMVGLGSIATYLLILTIVTSKFRKKIGYQRWQKLHTLNPILYIL